MRAPRRETMMFATQAPGLLACPPKPGAVPARHGPAWAAPRPDDPGAAIADLALGAAATGP